MPYAYSTLASDQAFVDYGENADGAIVARRKVVIKGGSGVATKGVITPIGAMATKITDEEAEFLENNAAFQRQAAAGFIKLDKAKKDGEKAAFDMSLQDKSRPLSEADMANAVETEAGKAEKRAVQRF